MSAGPPRKLSWFFFNRARGNRVYVVRVEDAAGSGPVAQFQSKIKARRCVANLVVIVNPSGLLS